jgi:opacity protein-like surface antigen
LLVGFARLRAGTAPGSLNTTDSEWQVGGGVSRQLTPHLDVVVSGDYAQYGANNGEYSPITMTAGVIWHFTKR